MLKTATENYTQLLPAPQSFLSDSLMHMSERFVHITLVRLRHYDRQNARSYHPSATQRRRNLIECLTQGHNKQTSRASLHALPSTLSAMQRRCEYHCSSFHWYDSTKESNQVYKPTDKPTNHGAEGFQSKNL